MKKFCILLLAITFSLNINTIAKAVEISVDGKFIVGAYYRDGLNFTKGSNTTLNSGAALDVWQRFYMGIDFIASETLSGRFMFRAPSAAVWGEDEFALSGSTPDNSNLFEVEEAYIEFILPQSDISVKMGKQAFGLNYLYTSGSPIFYDYAPGVSVNASIDENINLNIAWIRYNASENVTLENFNDVYGDIFMFDMPMHFENMKINPHFTYATFGDDTELEAYAGTLNPFDNSFDVYYAGVNSEFKVSESINIAADLLYSWANGTKSNNAKASAWLADLALVYNTGNGAIKLFAWYATGDDANDVKKDRYGRIVNISAGWGNERSAFYDEASLDIGVTSGVTSPTGSWAAGLEYDGFIPIEKMSLGGHVLWINGTNDDNISYFNGSQERNPSYLSTNDSVIDISAWADYQMYKELQISLNISYLIAQFEKDNYIGEEEDGFRTGLIFQYSF